MVTSAPQVGDRYIKDDKVVTVSSVDLRHGEVLLRDDSGEVVEICGLDSFYSNYAIALLPNTIWGITCITKCECGLDASGVGGRHSSYCPKAEAERA